MATTTDSDGNVVIVETVVVYLTATPETTTVDSVPVSSAVLLSTTALETTTTQPPTTTIQPVSTLVQSPSTVLSSSLTTISTLTTSLSVTQPRSSAIVSSSTQLSLPTVVTASSVSLPAVSKEVQSSTSIVLSTSSSTSISASAAAASTQASLSANSDAHKQAVVGGLAGAMGGAVFLAILLILCCCDRRRRKRESDTEKQLQRPPLLANEHSFWGPIPYLAGHKRGSVRSFRTADGNVIQVDLDNFARPFGEKEGWRESVGPRQLRVMNPDKSLPGTPSVASDRVPGFFNGRYRTSPQMTIPEHGEAPKLPTIHIEPVLSNESIVPSQPYLQGIAPVRHHLPEDPFQDPPCEQPRRPEMSRQGTSTRGWQALGNVPTPFKSRSSQDVAGEPQSERQSTITYSPASSRRASSVTDPFELESPWMRQGSRFIMQSAARRPANYEGT